MTKRDRNRTRPDLDPIEIDTSVAHAARIYEYYLGGVTNFAADREAAEHAAAVHPGGIETVRASVRSNRAFLVRVVRWLAAEVGIRQFRDVGSGVPNGTNVHAVVQGAIAGSRVVYVDNDPVVLAHAHELLADRERGAVAYLQDDLRDPASIVERAAETLDLTEPVAVLLIGVLHFLPDADDDTDPYRIVSRLVDAMVTESHLVVCHLARDIHPTEMAEVERRFNETTAETWQLRNATRSEGSSPVSISSRAAWSRSTSGAPTTSPALCGYRRGVRTRCGSGWAASHEPPDPGCRRCRARPRGPRA